MADFPIGFLGWRRALISFLIQCLQKPSFYNVSKNIPGHRQHLGIFIRQISESHLLRFTKATVADWFFNWLLLSIHLMQVEIQTMRKWLLHFPEYSLKQNLEGERLQTYLLIGIIFWVVMYIHIISPQNVFPYFRSSSSDDDNTSVKKEESKGHFPCSGRKMDFYNL